MVDLDLAKIISHKQNLARKHASFCFIVYKSRDLSIPLQR